MIQTLGSTVRHAAGRLPAKGTYLLSPHPTTHHPVQSCVWIDCVAINQHGDTIRAQNTADVSAFKAVLRQCTASTIVVVDMPRCNPAGRSW